MKTFANKVALITGGTSGIGRATALAFAREGAKVVVSGRRVEEGNETVRQVKAAGGEAIFVKVDVSKEADIKNLVDTTLRTYGRLDYAVNNAGVDGTMGPIVEQTGENYDFVMDINVKGTLLSMKHEIPALLRSGGGAIVNMSSAAGSTGFPGVSVYIATKHTINGPTKAAGLAPAQPKIRGKTVGPAPSPK